MIMDFELMASMMSADYSYLEKEIMDLDAGGLTRFILILWTGAMSLILPCH